MWPEADRWRAPVGDFPPPWASTWGDDEYGLWADLSVNGVTQRLRWIEPTAEAGFLMGTSKAELYRIKNDDWRNRANYGGSEPQRVQVLRGFWLADTPCTQAFWAAVRGGDTPSHFRDRSDSAERPVEQVSFEDVSVFLSALDALRPDCKPALPSEVQWEYACRAGTSTAYWWGNEVDAKRANTGQTIGETSPVKTYAPNPFGLYDVHGNVWEWCSDVWHRTIERPQAEPNEPGAANRSADRVSRGGSWFNEPDEARSASRLGRPTTYRLDIRGFRLLLRSRSTAKEARGR